MNPKVHWIGLKIGVYMQMGAAYFMEFLMENDQYLGLVALNQDWVHNSK